MRSSCRCFYQRQLEPAYSSQFRRSNLTPANMLNIEIPRPLQDAHHSRSSIAACAGSLPCLVYLTIDATFTPHSHRLQGLISMEEGSHEICSDEGYKAGLSCSYSYRGDAREALCLARGLRLHGNLTATWVQQPGFHNPGKHGHPRELDLSSARGLASLPGSCKGYAPDRDKVGLGAQRFLLEALTDGPNSRCVATIKSSVYFVADKYGGNNPWHAMEGFVHSFTSAAIYHLQADSSRVILLDRPFSGAPLVDYTGIWAPMWEATLSSQAPITSLADLILNASVLADAIDLSSISDTDLQSILQSPRGPGADTRLARFWATSKDAGLCFNKVVFAVHGGASLLTQQASPTCTRSPLIRGFVDMVLSRYNFQDHPVDASGGPSPPLSIVLIMRNGSSTNSKNRRLANPDELVHKLEGAVPEALVSAVTFGDISLSEQLAVVRRADVLLGVHGAGLTWTMFLRHGSAMVEIHTEGSSGRCDCFQRLAAWSGIHYYQVNGEDHSRIVSAVERAIQKIRHAP